MGKQFVLSVPDYTYSESFNKFLEIKLRMTVGSVGCGSTEYWRKTKPKNLRRRIIKNFGEMVYNDLVYFEAEED